MQIIERDAVHVAGPTTRAALSELSTVVPALWREVFDAHGADAVFAELSEEPAGHTHVITVGVLADEPAGEGVTAPAGRWLHHEHRGPLTSIGETYGEMFRLAADSGLRLGTLKLDVGYRADGQETSHDLYLLLQD